MEQFIVISTQSTALSNLSGELAKLAANCNCSIVKSHMQNMGCEFVTSMLLSGSWDSVAKFESNLASLEKTFGLKMIIQRTDQPTYDEALLPYVVQVVALDRPGIIQKITEFFDSQSVIIDELDSETSQAIGTDAMMFTVKATIHIPASCHIPTIRERFLVFCDDLNLDAVIEPMNS